MFFGEKSFEVDDLMRISNDGRGMISIVRVTDLQDRPKIVFHFYVTDACRIICKLPEEGDLDKPNWYYLLMKRI